MHIKITNPGALSTLQDLGRIGYQKQGFPVNGALDTHAMRLANLLLDNHENETVIEMTLSGITAIFYTDCTIAVTGANCTPLINNRPIPMNTAVIVQKGQILRCPLVINGCRSYLAVKGGFDIPMAMGSTSTNLKCKLGGLEGRRLEKGDVLLLKKPRGVLTNMQARTLPCPVYEKEITVRAVPGPQDDLFPFTAMELLVNSSYLICPDSDRMGMRLQGPVLPCKETYDIISDGTALGNIQVAASGQPIILLADRQTTGGYAKIATVISTDIPLLAQAKPGDTIRFILITVEEAQRLYCLEKQKFEILKRRIHG